jgi:hypothetical protein
MVSVGVGSSGEFSVVKMIAVTLATAKNSGGNMLPILYLITRGGIGGNDRVYKRFI